MKYKDLDIIIETPDFIAINKPAGLFSVPDRFGVEISLKQILQEKFEKVFIVHRLDKETSGVILFAKNAATHKTISELFENRKIEKYYLGLVQGSLIKATGEIDNGYPVYRTIRVNDGESYSIEIKIDNKFRIYQFSNPEIYSKYFDNVSEFKDFLNIVNTFESYIKLTSPQKTDPF